MADVDAPPLPPPVTTRPYFDGKPFASVFKKVRKLRDELAPKLNTAAQAFFGNPAINLAHAHPTTDPTLIQGPVRRITAYAGDLLVPNRLARPNAQMTGTFVSRHGLGAQVRRFLCHQPPSHRSTASPG